MKLFNRGRRTFNPGTPFALVPGKWTELAEEDAKKMLAMYPRDLTTNDIPTDPTAREIELEKENVVLKAKLAKFEASMTGLAKVVTTVDQPVNFDPGADLVASSEIPAVPETPFAAPKAKKKVTAVV